MEEAKVINKYALYYAKMYPSIKFIDKKIINKYKK